MSNRQKQVRGLLLTTQVYCCETETRKMGKTTNVCGKKEKVKQQSPRSKPRPAGRGARSALVECVCPPLVEVG